MQPIFFIVGAASERDASFDRPTGDTSATVYDRDKNEVCEVYDSTSQDQIEATVSEATGLPVDGFTVERIDDLSDIDDQY